MSRTWGVLHAETHGRGPGVVLIHGWGMHSGVWRDFAIRLARDFEVTLIDLPGHGRSGMIADFTLAGVGESLLRVAPAKAHWLGWSLGSQIALHIAATQPERVNSLTMMAGTARFTYAPDWPCGMDVEVLDRFAQGMMDEYQVTLFKFLSLQTWGLDNAREVLKILRERVAECDEPEPAALRAGLAILRSADLRPQLAALKAPLLLVLGGRDRLAPPRAGAAMQEWAPGAEVHVIENATHVPFLTHDTQCAAVLADFWRRNG